MKPTIIRTTPTTSTLMLPPLVLTPQVRIAPTAIRIRLRMIPMGVFSPGLPKGNVPTPALRLVRAPVAQWKSDGLLSRGSEVRILPGAFRSKVRSLRDHDDFRRLAPSNNAGAPRPRRSAAATNRASTPRHHAQTDYSCGARK